jgi:FkbM family methyltransferase
LATFSLDRAVRQLFLSYLSFVASGMIKTKPVRRVPGWWSGYATSTPLDANARLRLKLWDVLKGQIVRVTWYDGLRLELRVGTDISRLIFLGGEIDPNEFAFLDAFLQPGMCALDVGANEGLYTLFLRRRVGVQGHVVAIEPSARELAHLRRNLALNSFADVEIHATAIGQQKGVTRLHLAEDDHAGHNALGPPAAPWVRVTSEAEVPLNTLSELATSCEWPKIDLIKLDVEGMEFAALCGAEALLAKDRPLILFEGEPESLALRGAGLSEMILWLRGHGYVVMDFSALDGSPALITERDPVTVNLLAVPVERAPNITERGQFRSNP